MTMKRLFLTAAAVLLAGCSVAHHHNRDPYANPFYAKYLSPSNPQDQQIQKALDDVRGNPRSAQAHNTLGQLLVQKGFPKDAEREFERSVDSDSHFYPAWYNLGLVRAAQGDAGGARRAFDRTIHYKPGHAAALFQLGLMAEESGNREEAIEHYAKAFLINHELLDVHVNPRILDSKLVDLALVRAYPKEHNRQSMQFQPNPADYVGRSRRPLEAPSPQAPAEQIVTPAPPVTNPATQPVPPQTPPPPPQRPVPTPSQ
jgi:tetratricopeptide (TPR) repeat protein